MKRLIDIPTPSCHASTLLRTNTGYLLAWFGGTREGDTDVGIWVCAGDASVRVDREPGIPHWNPVLHRRMDGTVLLYYKVGHQIPGWRTYVTCSHDEGLSWSIPHELIPSDDTGGRGPVKNKPIRLSDGSILAPASSERGIWRVFTDRSTDDGRTYIRSTFVDAPVFNGKPVGLIQPTLWESSPGQVHMLARSNAGYLFRADSRNYGISWSPAYPTPLPNNNSGVDLASLPDGTLVLAHNPVSGNWAARTPLVLSVSYDGGNTWRRAYTLEDARGEFSYPAVIPSEDGVAVSYTWNREKIALCEIPREMLCERL
jgi:predicted neuraminidase